MDRLIQTPTIFLYVCEHIDLSTLLNLRLTNRATKSLISEYERSICTTIALRYYARDRKRQSMEVITSITQLQRRWRRDICRKFAIVVTSSVWDRFGFEKPVEDPLADPLRQRIQRGCMVLARLSELATSIEARTTAEPVKKFFLGSRRLAARRKAIKTEEAILQTRVSHIKELTESEVGDFEIVCQLIGDVFKHDQMSDLLPPIKIKGQLGKEASWLAWYILHEGPSLLIRLFQHWTVNGLRKEFVEAINRVWHGKTKGERKIESQCALKFFESLQRPVEKPDDFVMWDVN